MTEAEWLSCKALDRMVKEVRGRVSDRKLRLLACACARRVDHLLAFDECRSAIEVVERYADGRSSVDELLSAIEAAKSRFQDGIRYENASVGLAVELADAQPARAARRAAEVALSVLTPTGTPRGNAIRIAEREAQCELARDIIRNPFRATPLIDSAWIAWNDGAALRLAEAVYDGRRFDRLPELADALEAAGGQDPVLLGHLAEKGPHVRGCWAVDLILGKQ